MRRRLANPVPGLDEYANVRTTEEKGTDVNIATYLIMDGYDGDYEQAVVISNDSDLALPIRMAHDKLNLPVGVVNPNLNERRNPMSAEFKNAATFRAYIRRRMLRDSKFPGTLEDDAGEFAKPRVWV